ncbi:MAG TPA: hypothetical protein DHW40_05245 [Microbacterium sp.]|nr:hypothetical protein [Microbacterium sp.]
MIFRVPNQPRLPGSEWARQLYFGADTGSSSSPIEFRETLARIAERVSRGLTAVLQGVDEAADSRLIGTIASTAKVAASNLTSVRDDLACRDVERPFRVVLMGRTMAGKSTLFEYLSGGTGARIGVGAQRTTRDTSARMLSDLAGVEVVDTPGVGAMDGWADYETAFAEVADADLVLWVATDQATQEHTGRALRRLADIGKPMLVILNCLADIRDEINFFDLLEDPDRIFGGDAEGNLAPIRRHLSTAGGRYLDALPIHAQAAQLSMSDAYSDDDSVKLFRSSRIESLVDAIRVQRDHTAETRRLVSLADFVKHALLEATAEVEDARASVRALLAAIRGSQTDFGRRARRRVEDAHSELKAVFAAAVSARERWIERVDVDKSDKQINAAWDDELRAIQDELDASATNVALRLETDLKVLAVDVADDWSAISTDGFRDLGGIGAIWGNRTVKVGGRVAAALGGSWAGAKLGALLGTAIGGPPGTAVGGVIGGIIGGLVVGLAGTLGVDWLADRFFRNPADVHQRRRQRVHDQLAPILEDLTHKVEAARDGLREAWLKALDDELARQSAAGDEMEAILDRLSHLSADELEPALTSVDTELARQMLRSSGRDRAAEALIRATRWRGAGMALELPTSAFTEMILFPMADDVERVVPTRAEASHAMNALQIVRTLADREVLVHRMSEGELVVTLGSQIADGAREAWEALARVHTGATVRIADSLEGDAGDQGPDPRAA